MNYAKNRETKSIITEALKEDIGRRDVTTESLIPKTKYAQAILLAKQDCVICGLDIAMFTFKLKDRNVKFKSVVKDGKYIKKGTRIAELKGKSRSILTAERVALNFLSFLSGIATKTKKFVDSVKPYKAKIMDTRKTIPGLRGLSKYAVRVAGGVNHRTRLDEMVIIKDNHLKIIGSFKRISKIRRKYRLEIEVKNLTEYKDALALRPEVIMLDNMSIAEMKNAVKIRNSLFAQGRSHYRPKLEASGGISLENVKKVASTGVDMISVGGLTHSVSGVDISLEIM